MINAPQTLVTQTSCCTVKLDLPHFDVNRWITQNNLFLQIFIIRCAVCRIKILLCNFQSRNNCR